MHLEAGVVAGVCVWGGHDCMRLYALLPPSPASSQKASRSAGAALAASMWAAAVAAGLPVCMFSGLSCRLSHVEWAGPCRKPGRCCAVDSGGHPAWVCEAPDKVTHRLEARNTQCVGDRAGI